jgi:CubicO group peptidase (beta-lactamase class C family)
MLVRLAFAVINPFLPAETPPPSKPAAPVKADKQINALLASVRAKHKLPGLVGAILRGDRLVAIGVDGVRKAGSSEALRVDDKMHLGSCTKTLTATLIALLVEEKKLSWDTTILQVFPRLKDEIHPNFRGVTLAQLLTHRAGLPADGPWRDLGNQSTTAQRLTLLKKMLKKAPDSKPGTKYVYSNVGYALAGLVAETVTGKSWEELMRRRLFKPLGMTSAGLGVPGTRDRVDQPWGHLWTKEAFLPLQHDNAAALGPAGTVHCSLPDWAKFIALHLRGAQGRARLLKAATFKYLLTPPKGQEYACGWVVAKRPWAGGLVLAHDGTNKMWFAVVAVAPGRDFAVMVAANAGGGPVPKACMEALQALARHFDKRFAKKKADG